MAIAARSAERRRPRRRAHDACGRRAGEAEAHRIGRGSPRRPTCARAPSPSAARLSRRLRRASADARRRRAAHPARRAPARDRPTRARRSAGARAVRRAAPQRAELRSPTPPGRRGRGTSAWSPAGADRVRHGRPDVLAEVHRRPAAGRRDDRRRRDRRRARSTRSAASSASAGGGTVSRRTPPPRPSGRSAPPRWRVPAHGAHAHGRAGPGGRPRSRSGRAARRSRRRPVAPHPVARRRDPVAREPGGAARTAGGSGSTRIERRRRRPTRGHAPRAADTVRRASAAGARAPAAASPLVRSFAPERPPRFAAGHPRRRLIGHAQSCCSSSCRRVLVKVGRAADRSRATRCAAAGGRSSGPRTAHLRAHRGTIFDRNGEELALSVPGQHDHASTRSRSAIRTARRTFAHGARPRRRTSAARSTTMAAKDNGFVYVARQVDDALADAARRRSSWSASTSTARTSGSCPAATPAAASSVAPTSTASASPGSRSSTASLGERTRRPHRHAGRAHP